MISHYGKRGTVLNYYNENDPYPAQWLRNLIQAGHLPAGDVDERSIEDVQPEDLAGYTQCHFFAGIGGWPHALRLAGWPDDKPVWTGSCPCQPFSCAGVGGGADDPRHLWPTWYRLIRECRPNAIFGEQVASAIGHGWLDGLCDDVEAADYTVRAAVLGAHSVGAPHRRQRLYWMGYTEGAGINRTDRNAAGEAGARRSCECEPNVSRYAGDMANADSTGRNQGRTTTTPAGHGHTVIADGGGDWPGAIHNPWRDADWLRCRDGKWRPVETGTFPLADGIPGRVGQLRAYGNAIVPHVAAAFVQWATESEVQF